ncbi:uncharacterized protein LOC112347174 isoform X1 [Selaginella moellendorffii]|uniref:uncharacterized protein LOC112347174 isoform X1 n=1 Tax=Selaginella moellendorffii TaxID=88036 RepID=UPI000D1C706B|nr:uncharacterized protein LOC112347174 isoform X1 [Selaginella moellendorffii]|eukprot:XP_024533344.1 uncharacterized protein LOC112347174 isoform X1 [Selaginella moellendorffii]
MEVDASTVEEFVEFIEDIDGAEGCEFYLDDGRVAVHDVLQEFSAVFISVKRYEQGRVRWRRLQAGEDGLSRSTYVPGSSHTIRATKAPTPTLPITLQAAPVSRLLDVYTKQLEDARFLRGMPARRVPGCKLPLVDNGAQPYLHADLGDYFTLVGRDETIQHLMAAAARVFATFMNTTASASDIERKEFMLMVIGFPGAGKTTVGSCLSALLREAWLRGTETGAIDAILEDQLGSGRLVTQFKEMVNNVLETGKHLRMYHSLETTRTGGALLLENGLEGAQVLALRSLHAALCPMNTTAYGDFLKELDGIFPGLRNVLAFGDVVDFIRTGLKVPADKRIFLSWFFDEVNKARPQRGRPAASSWIHEAFSAYVQHIKGNRGGLTFPVLTAATTRFSGATMRYTSTENATSIFIPIRPLKEEEVEHITKIFFSRLGDTLDMEKPFELKDGLRKLIKLAGGNPRMLDHLLRGLMPEHPHLEALKFYEKVDQDLTQADLCKTITNAWKRIKGSYYLHYLHDSNYLLVLRALYVALLGTLINRDDLVWPGIYSDKWGFLESCGLVGLLRNEEEPPPHKQVKLSKQEDTKNGMRAFSIMFSPLLIYHLVENLHVAELRHLWPPILDSNPKVKEVSDLMCIVFMIYMGKLFHDREKDTVFEFTLKDILPSNFRVPARMQALKFRLPAGARFGPPKRQPHQIHEAEAFQAFLNDNKKQFYWVGIGNHGPDSFIHLKLVVVEDTLDDFFIFLESKHRECYEGQQARWEQDFLKKTWRIEQWIEDGEYAVIFMTDQALHNVIRKVKKQDKMVVPKVDTCYYGYPQQSPFGLFSAVRHTSMLAAASWSWRGKQTREPFDPTYEPSGNPRGAERRTPPRTRSKTRGQVGRTRSKTPGQVGRTRSKTRGQVGRTRSKTPGQVGRTRSKTRGQVGRTRSKTQGQVGRTRSKGATKRKR